MAQRLNRKWIGIDITYQSISLILKRLEDSFGSNILTNVLLDGVPKDINSARALANKKDDRVRKEFEKWAILTYSNNRAIVHDKKGADQGIDGVAYIQEGPDTTGKVLIPVKSGQNVGVAAVRDLVGVVTREQGSMGILITLESPTKPMLQEAKQGGTYTNPLMVQSFDKIQIVTVEEILQGSRLKLPLTLEVLKKATQVIETENLSMDINGE